MTSEENFALLLGELGQLMKIEPLVPDEDGLVTLEIDAMPFHIQHAAGRGSVLLACELATLPPTTPAGVYRRLLAAQLFDQGTGGGKFAIEEESNTVVFSFERALDGIPFQEFREIMGNFLNVCEYWRKQLVENSEGGFPEAAVRAEMGGVRV